MAINTIGYVNKVALNTNPDVADINKVTDDDMNEIKSVVNANANLQGDLSDLETPTTTDLVGAINSVVVSGTGANGSYIKYSDGTMICYNTQTFTNVSCTSAWGSIYTNNEDVRDFDDFPQAFISTPIVMITHAGSGNDFWIISNGGSDPTTTKPLGWQIGRGTMGSGMSLKLSYIAIGKWK